MLNLHKLTCILLYQLFNKLQMLNYNFPKKYNTLYNFCATFPSSFADPYPAYTRNMDMLSNVIHLTYYLPLRIICPQRTKGHSPYPLRVYFNDSF